MKSFVKGALLSAFAVLLIMAVATPALAQGVEVSGNVGFSNLNGLDNSKHMNYGFSGGVNIPGGFAALGEYAYLPMGSLNGVTGKNQLVGGALRSSFLNFLPVSPYVLVGGGLSRVTGSAQGVSASVNGEYASFGAGASLKAGKHWGLRPEVRFERQFYSLGTITSGQNDVRGMISLYYHFGLNPLPHP